MRFLPPIMRILFIQLIFLYLPSFSFADETGFEVTITPAASQILITDTLEVGLDLTFPEGYQVDMDALRQNILRSSHFYERPFAIVDMKVGNPEKSNARIMSQHILISLQPLRIGEASLTLYNIPFVSEDKNKSYQWISPIFPIQILSVEAPPQFHGHLAPLLTFSKGYPLELDAQNEYHLLEDPQLRKEEELFNEQMMNSKRIPWIPLGTLLLILFVFWIFLKYPPVKPPLTEAQIAQAAKAKALMQLELLKAKQLPEKGFFDEFYVQLTHPVRTYIEERYHIPASVHTTPEFLSEMAQNPVFSSQNRQKLKQFLIQADRVKFGHYRPSLEECNRAQELAHEFIYF